MWLVIILFISIIVALIISGSKDVDRQLNQKKKMYENQGLKYICGFYDVDYYGGFDDVGATEKCYVELISDRLEFTLYGGNIFKKKTVVLDTIKNIRVETQTNIQNQISLGKMVVFGLLSFAMKPKSRVVSDIFVVIKIADDEEYSIILKVGDYTNFIEKINNSRNVN